MSWLQRYRIRHYISNAIWIIPAFGMLLALLAAPLLYRLDLRLGWGTGLQTQSIELVLGTMAASMFTFIVFVSSALLVAIQLASAQLTPRVIGLMFRDPVTKLSLMWFTFSFTLSLAILIRIRTFVPVLSVRIAAYSCLASLVIFLYLMNHVGRSLRPSGILRVIVFHGRKVIESTYPRLLTGSPDPSPHADVFAGNKPSRIIGSTKSGVILTLDIRKLVALAQKADCIIEILPRVGDFVPAGGPLFQIYGEEDNLSDKGLRQLIALGLERTMEHDPAFAFRIIVDIAAKALSPAINDPTTAVLALDQIHHLLQNVGSRYLDDGYTYDETGRIRFVIQTPNWEDYVHLAVTEIRHLGAGNIQVVRRMRLMLESLIHQLPEERAHLLRQELRFLNNSNKRIFPEAADQEWAEGAGIMTRS